MPERSESTDVTQRPLEIEDLYQFRLISEVDISPDGRRTAFVCKRLDREADEIQSNVYVVDQDRKVVQFTSGKKDSAPRWSPDGRWLAFLSGRKEKAQIYLLSTTGGESFALTDLPLGAGLPVWSPDSRSIAFVAQVSTGRAEEKPDEKKVAPARVTERASYKQDGTGYIGDRRRHIFLADLESRSVRQVTDGDFHDDNPSWSPDGTLLVFSSRRGKHWDMSQQRDIFLMPVAGGEPRRLTEGGAYDHPVFSPDGRRIAFDGIAPPQDWLFIPARVYSCSIDGGDLCDELGAWDGNPGCVVISDVVNPEDPYHPWIRWMTDGILFLGTERGAARVYQASGGQVSTVTPGPVTVVGYSRAEDGTIATGCASAARPAEVLLWREGSSESLTNENAFLDRVKLSRPQRAEFTGADGEQSEGWLLAPNAADDGPHPLILYIHGGPMMAHGETLFFEYQILAACGFGVFLPNIHGSASYGRAYQTSILGDWGNLDYQDILAGTERAIAEPWVDSSRLGVAGGSYGGFMTNWIISHDSRFRAAVTERCLSNVVSFFGTADNGWIWKRAFGAYPEEDMERLWSMSPLKYVANVTTPTLVIHSEYDERTPIEQGEQLFGALKRLGLDTKLVVFPEESHGMTRIGKPSHRVERLRIIVDWFQQHLNKP